jgi:hypothetical protein
MNWMMLVDGGGAKQFQPRLCMPEGLESKSLSMVMLSESSATTMVTPVIHGFFQHAIEQNQEKHQCVLTSVERKSHFMPTPSSKETSRL